MIERLRLKEAIVVTVTGLVAGVVCFGVASSMEGWPPYRATATLIIDQTPDNDESGEISAEGIAIAQQTMAALIRREPLTSEVASSLGIGMESEDLVDSLDVDLPEGAPIVEISASHGDAAIAAVIANRVAEAAARVESPLAGASVLSPAETPPSPVTSAYIIIGAAALAGGLLAVAALALLSALSTEIHTIDDVRANTSLPIIGHVHLRRDGGRQEMSDRVLLSALTRRLRADGLDVLFTSASEAPALSRLVALQTEVMGGPPADDPTVGFLDRPSDVEPETEPSKPAGPGETEVAATHRDPAGSNGTGSNGTGSDGARSNGTGSNGTEVGGGRPPRSKLTSGQRRFRLGTGGRRSTVTAGAGGDPGPEGTIDLTGGGAGAPSAAGDHWTMAGEEYRRVTFTADEWLEAIGSKDRAGEGRADGHVAVILGPPILIDPSLLLKLSGRVRVVLVAERNVTRGPDLLAASNAIVEAGGKQAAVLLIG